MPPWVERARSVLLRGQVRRHQAIDTRSQEPESLSRAPKNDARTPSGGRLASYEGGCSVAPVGCDRADLRASQAVEELSKDLSEERA